MDYILYHENPSGSEAFHPCGDGWVINPDDNVCAVFNVGSRNLTREKRIYPFNDFSAEALDVLRSATIDTTHRLIRKGRFSEESMGEILSKLNGEMRVLNVAKGKQFGDTENYDLIEAVGAVSVIIDGTLYFGMLEDCYINVLRGRNLKDKVSVNYQIMKSKKFLDDIFAGERSYTLLDTSLKNAPVPKDWEFYWCTRLRNNPAIVDENGDRMGWGSLTGEPGAEEFFQTGSVKLKKKDHVLLVTDWMIPVVADDELLAWILKNAEPTYRFHESFRRKIEERFTGKNDSHIADKEKTLLYFRPGKT